MRQEYGRFDHFFLNRQAARANNNPTMTNCGRDPGDECNNHKPQQRKHDDECTNTHTLRSKL